MTLDPIPHARESAVEVLRNLEWKGEHHTCPACGEYEPAYYGRGCHGHTPDCRLIAALVTPSGDEVAELRTLRYYRDVVSGHVRDRWPGDEDIKGADTLFGVIGWMIHERDRASAAEAQRDALGEALLRLKTECEIEGLDKRAGFDCWISKANEALATLTPHQQGNGARQSPAQDGEGSR